MKKIMVITVKMLFVFVCFFALHIHSQALQTNTYKTVTNCNIIYIVENNGAFAYSWQFDKSLYKDNMNFSLNILDNSSSLYNISTNIDTNIKRKYLFFEHHGSLPTTALMKVKVSDKFNDGDKLYLYYYDNKTDKLQFVDNNLVVKDGFVEFKIEHCSDYVLTGSIVKKALDNPQSMTFLIVTLIILGVVLVAATLFLNNKK